jgi:hypothetical protein
MLAGVVRIELGGMGELLARLFRPVELEEQTPKGGVALAEGGAQGDGGAVVDERLVEPSGAAESHAVVLVGEEVGSRHREGM